MAQWEAFDERLNVERLYQERFVVAFLPRHGLAAQNGVAMANANGESYLLRINCEFKDHLRSVREEQGVELQHVYRSEREARVSGAAQDGGRPGTTPAHQSCSAPAP